MARGILAKNLIHGTKSDQQSKPYGNSDAKRGASQADRIVLAKQLIVTLERHTLADAGYLKPSLALPCANSAGMGTA